MQRIGLFALLLLGLVLSLVTNAHAQVTIAPTTVFIDSDRFSSFVVSNNSNQAQEISIEFLDVVPTGNAEGLVTNVAAEEAPDTRYLMQDWLRAFPRVFVLEPGQRQTVRLTVRPPSDLASGGYFKRLVVRSNPQAVEIGEVISEGVGTQINIIFAQTISVVYRAGNARIGVEMDGNPTISENENEFRLLMPLKLTGNAPFIGTIAYSFSSGNTVIYESLIRTSIFANGTRLISIPRQEIVSGNYNVKVEFNSQRPDIPSTNQLPMNPTTFQFEVRIP